MVNCRVNAESVNHQMPNSPYPGTQAVQRALRLLKIFSDEKPEYGLSELSRVARLSKSTAYRILSALEAEGLVAFSRETEKYRLGPEVIALGGRAMRQNSLRTAALPVLQGLAEETGETAGLEVMIDGEMTILEEIPGHHLLGPSQSIGTRWPVHATSTGKAMLAHLPEDERRRVLDTPLKPFTSKTITDWDELAKTLDSAQRAGYATAVEELEVGFVAVGAPVLNPLGRPVAAISVGGPIQRFSPDRVGHLGPMVRSAGQRISQAIGWSGK